jgi:uncharacterized protein YjiS (DUF1127 family)
MEVSSLIARSSASPAGYALIEILAGWWCRSRRRCPARLVAAQRRAQARWEAWLSDRSLKDIGPDRNQIERLFR